MPRGWFRSRWPGILALVLSLMALLIWVMRPAGPDPSRGHPSQLQARPNIVLIVTDDQRWDTLHVMPHVRRLLVQEGMSLQRAFVSNPRCCPSRATILTGRYSHTTGVYANGGDNGGWQAFQPSEPSTIATALHGVGYRTALIGKYLNGYGVGRDPYVPPGWDSWLAFSDGNGSYYDYTMYDGARGTRAYGSQPDDYSTDLIRRRAVSFIRNVPGASRLFLMVTPYAPHAGFKPAPRHEGDLASAPVPLGPAVNEADVSDKPVHIKVGAGEDPEVLRSRTRDQWETLLAVDQLVSEIFAALRDTGRVGNTLVLFTSDNGFSNREHGWVGKLVPYEESIRVPMVVRFSGKIPPGTVSKALASNVDIAPTIADFAGVSLPTDGVSLRPLLTGTMTHVRNEIVVEHQQRGDTVPAYCGVRTRAFTFAHYVTGEEELYDLRRDPAELENVAAERPSKAAQLRALTKSLCRPVPPGFSW